MHRLAAGRLTVKRRGVISSYDRSDHDGIIATCRQEASSWMIESSNDSSIAQRPKTPLKQCKRPGLGAGPLAKKTVNCLRTLVVFYSQSNETRDVALDLAFDLNADLMEICEEKPRRGFFGRLISGAQSFLGIPCRTLPFTKEPLLYDVVIVGTPIVALSISAPVRAFFARAHDRLPNVAFFATHAGNGVSRAILQVTALARQSPIAALSIDSRIKSEEHYVESLCDFETRILQRANMLRDVRPQAPTSS